MTEERVAKSEVAQPLRLERASELTAHGESLASHRDGRGAPPARRDDREYREYLSEEQRSRRGCIARRMQPDFHHGLLRLRRIRSCHQKTRLRREDVCGVRRTDGLAALVERDEADAALHDERVLPRGDHVSEAHAPDRV